MVRVRDPDPVVLPMADGTSGPRSGIRVGMLGSAPTRTRPARSLLALALVVNLSVAGAPETAMGHQPDAPPAGDAAAAPRPSPDAAALALPARAIPPRTRSATSASAACAPSIAPLSPPPSGVRHPPVPPSRGSRDRPWPSRSQRPSRYRRSSHSPGSVTSFRGRNHVWIPALGIDRSVSFYSCSASAYPGDRVYRWGCGGSNNVYLFGHAHSVSSPPRRVRPRPPVKGHEGHVRRRERQGQHLCGVVVEAHDAGQGRLGLRRPVSAEPHAPDVCRGASQYRLIVRLLKVN